MGGKSGGGDGEAKKARQAEEERQARIRQGTARINEIFDGGWSGTGQLGSDAVFDPNATYYNADGSAWSMPTAASWVNDALGKLFVKEREARGIATNARNGGQSGEGSWMLQRGPHGDSERVWVPSKSTGGTAGGVSAQEKAFREALAGGKIFSGRQQSGGFNDEFYNSRRQAFMDYANPQLEDQYGKAQKELTFSLSRNGLLDSSVRGQKAGELQKSYDLNKQQIADQALSYETQARNAVEDARANLITTLNATGDATGAANAALARSAALSQPAAYSPLTNLFADFTNTLGKQSALERANYYSGGQTGSRYNTGLFAPNSGSVKVGS